jgi:hypothetical protein
VVVALCIDYLKVKKKVSVAKEKRKHTRSSRQTCLELRHCFLLSSPVSPRSRSSLVVIVIEVVADVVVVVKPGVGGNDVLESGNDVELNFNLNVLFSL